MAQILLGLAGGATLLLGLSKYSKSQRKYLKKSDDNLVYEFLKKEDYKLLENINIENLHILLKKFSEYLNENNIFELVVPRKLTTEKDILKLTRDL